MTHEQNICFFSLPTENLRLIVRAVSLQGEAGYYHLSA